MKYKYPVHCPAGTHEGEYKPCEIEGFFKYARMR
jgi:hypothetical protein